MNLIFIEALTRIRRSSTAGSGDPAYRIGRFFAGGRMPLRGAVSGHELFRTKRVRLAGWILICVALAGCKSASTDARPSAAYTPQWVLDEETVRVPLVNDCNYRRRVKAEAD